MNKGYLAIAAGVCLAVGAVGRADTIRTSTQTVPLPGTIQKMSPLEVELKLGVSTKTIPVNEIVSISYDREPDRLKTARNAVLNGRYEDALSLLNKMELADQTRPEIKQDIEFYRALCRAELALGGSGEIVAAGKQMAAFVKAHPGSYHWLKANEVLGDLYLAIGPDEQTAYELAEEHYAELGKAPWPDYKMRAGVAVGRARLAQGKTAEALKSFESVLEMGATGPLAQAQRLAAMIGKARCLIAGEKHDQAVQLARQAIASSDPERVELNARAYNTLGTALRKLGRTKEAVLAFLHVDVLYFSVPETHAEALANLAQLWQQIHKPEQADRARRMLEQRYRNSRWAP